MRCSMLRNILALVIIITAARPGWPVPADEAGEMLARAEALYYEADFAKSVELLLRADELLAGQAGRLEERTAVKLQLALGFIGLNDNTRGKAYLKELYALDSDHRIDPQAFSPKVIRLAEEAKAEQSELELAAGRGLLAWRKDFTAGEFALAARDYRELLSLNSSQAIEEVRTEYRRALSGLADSWNKACTNDDVAAMEKARRRVDALIPDPSFGEDIRATMKTCAHTGCVQMTFPLALSRLKNRVDPQIPPHLLSLIKDFPMTIRVRARINEAGDVAAAELSGGNALVYDAVRAAFGQWKFFPALVQGAARCVDTEIPIVLKFGQR